MSSIPKLHNKNTFKSVCIHVSVNMDACTGD